MNPSSLPYANSIRDLIVYQRQRQLSREVFKVSKETAKDDGYLSAADCARLLGLCEEIGRMLGSMMDRSSFFCDATSLREEPTGYYCSEPSVDPDVPADH